MLLLVIGFLHGLFDQVLNVLKRISDEDCLLLGLNPKFARPDWMILQVLPVPPPPVRPSVMMDTSSRSEVSLIPIYSLRPKINNFVEIFRQIKNAGKRHMCPHLLSFPVGYLLNLVVIICMHL